MTTHAHERPTVGCCGCGRPIFVPAEMISLTLTIGGDPRWFEDCSCDYCLEDFDERAETRAQRARARKESGEYLRATLAEWREACEEWDRNQSKSDAELLDPVICETMGIDPAVGNAIAGIGLAKVRDQL